jgi:hypothetical protein
MKHPEFLLLPVAMIADYLLTIASARLRDGGYAEHFRTEHFELNPVWQKTVAKKRWLNARHLVATFVLSTFLIACVEALPKDMALVAFLGGAMIGVQGAVLGRHLANLATFAYVRRHPGAIAGSVTLQHELVLWLSTFQTASMLVIALALALCVPHPAVLGVFAGVAALVLVHLVWIVRARRLAKRRAAPAWPTAPQAETGERTASGSVLPSASNASGTNLP